MRLIEILMVEPDGLTPQEMLVVLDTSRSSLFNLLARLKALGYVEQSERRGRYRAGPRLTAWRAPSSDSIQSLLAAFYLEAGRQNWDETLLLCVPAAEGVLVLGQVESIQPVRSAYTLGDVSNRLAAARAVLNANPADEIRANGYAIETPQQLVELALPICPDGSTPTAALLLTVPSYRWTRDSLLKECLSALREMTARLSYRMGAATYAPYQGSRAVDVRPETQLKIEDIHHFLAGPWTARLACVRPDGKPHVIPVWQAWDGTQFTVIAWEGSQWAEYLLQNPSVSLTIDEPWPPFRRVVARGSALPWSESASSSAIETLIRNMSRRYLGDSAASLKTENVLRVFQINVASLRGWQGLTGPPDKAGDFRQ